MKEVVGTKQQWRAFYAEARPCMADLLIDGIEDRIPKWYAGKYRKSDLLEEAYEATDFFPALGEKGVWLRFTAAAIRDARGALIGAIETLEDITERMTAEIVSAGKRAAALQRHRGVAHPDLRNRARPQGDVLEPGPREIEQDPGKGNDRDQSALARLLRERKALHVRSARRSDPGDHPGVVRRSRQIEAAGRHLRSGRVFPRPGR